MDICANSGGVAPYNQAVSNLVSCNTAGRVSALVGGPGGAGGTLPAAIGQLSQLTYISVGGQGLYGTIPSTISALALLQVLQFGGQYYYVSKLTGTLPDLSQMADLRYLDLGGNSLSGSIAPAMFAAMSRLEYVDFHGGNQFTGALPPSLLNSSSRLKVVDVSANSFSGPLPSATAAPALQYLNLRDNSFSGTLPQGFLAGIAQIKGLYLGNNQLSGTLPDLSVLTSLTSTPPGSYSPFQLDGTGLSGWAVSKTYGAWAFVPVNSNGGMQASIVLLDLSRNSFTGVVNTAYLPFNGVKSSTFQGTDLSNNQLSAANYTPGSMLFNVAAMHPQIGFGVTGTSVNVSSVVQLQQALSLRFNNASTGYYYATVNRAITTIYLTADLKLSAPLVVGANPFADSSGSISLQPAYPPAWPYGTTAQHGNGYPMQTTFVGLQLPTQQNPTGVTIGCTEPTAVVASASNAGYSTTAPCLISPSRSVTIIGACPSGPCNLFAPIGGRHFEVYQSGLRLQNLILTGGTGPVDYSGNYYQYQISGVYTIQPLYGGGSVLADGGSVLEVNNCTFSGNIGQPPGGGALASLAMVPQSVTVINSVFSNNAVTSGAGGAIYTRGGAVLVNTTFTANTATNGGAVSAVLGVNVSNCTFLQNTAHGNGGAIAVPPVSATNTGLVSYFRPALIDRWLSPRLQPDSALNATVFTANSGYAATSTGGALFAPAGSLVRLAGCTFQFNSAYLAGGALAGDGVTDVGSTFFSNDISGGGIPDACSSAGGGALAVSGSRGLSLTGTVFTQNQGATQGGAILATYSSPFGNGLGVAAPIFAPVLLTNVTLTNNMVASGGGGAMVLSNLNATLVNVTCSNNQAGGFGGCLNALQLGGLAITGGSVFSSNAAATGGAVAVSCGIACEATAWGCGVTLSAPAVVVSISQSTFYSNGATSQGGGLYVRGGGLQLSGVNISANSANGIVGQGGGLFMAEYWSGNPSRSIPLAASGLSLANTSFASNIAFGATATSFPSELYSGTSSPGAGGGLFFSSTYQTTPVVASGGCSWVNNMATTGAGAYLYGSTSLTLTNGLFTGNFAFGAGGGLVLSNPTVLSPPTYLTAALSATSFAANTATTLGGAVVAISFVGLNAAGCSFTNNSAANGGAFALSQPQGVSSVALVSTTTAGNTAGTAGGLFYTDATNATLAPATSCTVPCTGVTCLAQPANCSGNVAPNGANTLVASPIRFTCSLNSTGTVVKSGQALPVFGVSLYDALGNLVIEAPDVVATLNTNNNNLAGTTAAQYRNGSATFLALVLTGLPNTSTTLTYTLSSATLPLVSGLSGTVNVSLSQCGPTEAFDATQLKCVCAAGTALNYSTSTCTLCPLGQYAPSTGSAACLINTPGYYSSQDRTRQIACPIGTFLNGSSLACSACAPGSFTSLAGQTTCQVNPAGSVSSPQTTLSSSLSLGGVSASSIGQQQYGTLATSISAALNLSVGVNVTLTSVTDVAARRRLAATKVQVNYTVVASGTATSAALTTLIATRLNTSAALTQAVATSLARSGDLVLSVLPASAITAAVPVASTVYLQAEPCAAGTYLNAVNQTCDPCAVGTVAPTSSAVTCTVCPARTAWISASVACQACPDNAVTSPNTPRQCACSAGYYDTLYGASIASPVCAPCPLGGVCTTGLLGADVDWWRASTVSDVLYKCKVGNCLQEGISGPLTAATNTSNALSRGNSTAPTNCVDGHAGPLCALCLPGYALQSGECKPCPPSDAFAAWSAGSKAALIILCLLAGLAFIAVGFFQPLSPRLEAGWGTVTGHVGAAVHWVTSAPQRCLACCIPALRTEPTQRLATARLSAAGEAPSTRLPSTPLPSMRLASMRQLARARSTKASMRLAAGGTARTLTRRVSLGGEASGVSEPGAPVDGDADASVGSAADAEPHTPHEAAAAGAVEHPDGVPQHGHHVTTSAEAAAAAARGARKSGAELMMAGMEGEALAMAAAGSRRLSDMLGVDLPGDGGDDDDDDGGEEEDDDFYGLTGESLELLEKARRFLEKAQKYAKIVINFYQIVSTFIRSLDIPWPHVFVTTMGKVSLINLNLVRLPKAACLTPQPSYYQEFNGYTLGLLCALLFIACFWAFGRFALARYTLAAMSAEEAAERKCQFSSTCLQRTLMLLYLVYPGVSVAIFGIFSCTAVGGTSYLDQDVRITCYDAVWWRYCGGAIVWLLLVPAGVPLFFNALLKRFRVPDMAALVEDNAWLREAAEHTWRLGMPQPGGVDMQRLCCDTIEDNHLAMLHAVLLHDANADAAADILAGRVPAAGKDTPEKGHGGDKAAPAASEESAPPSLLVRCIHRILALRATIAGMLRPETKLEHLTAGEAERATQLRQLLLWCRHSGVLSIGSLIWYDDLGLPEAPVGDAAKHPGTPHRTGLRSHEVPELLKRASIECGFLFSIYTSRCWYWESVELLRKLVLTSILALISPGSAGQVVVGCLVALFALLANIKLKPFAERSLNVVNQIAQLNLFLFLFVALLLKVNLDGDNSAYFFTGIVVFLSVVPVALPFALQAYIRLGGFSGEDAVDAKDAAEGGKFEAE